MSLTPIGVDDFDAYVKSEKWSQIWSDTYDHAVEGDGCVRSTYSLVAPMLHGQNDRLMVSQLLASRF